MKILQIRATIGRAGVFQIMLPNISASTRRHLSVAANIYKNHIYVLTFIKYLNNTIVPVIHSTHFCIRSGRLSSRKERS